MEVLEVISSAEQDVEPQVILRRYLSQFTKRGCHLTTIAYSVCGGIVQDMYTARRNKDIRKMSQLAKEARYCAEICKSLKQTLEMSAILKGIAKKDDSGNNFLDTLARIISSAEIDDTSKLKILTTINDEGGVYEDKS